jgi:FkbM family methyltransferase
MIKIIEKLKTYGPKTLVQYGISEMTYRAIGALKNSYSQRGEDLIIDKLLGFKEQGFFVDVGANDPSRFSNTCRFYNRGWNGINIEPDINKFLELKKNRENDINLNIGIAEKESKFEFYEFIPDTLSTFSEKEAGEYIRQGYRCIGHKRIQVRRLEDILDKYCTGKTIDFLSIDTEGYDMQVLKSNNWKKFRPMLICIESSPHDKNGYGRDDGEKHEPFLKKRGYEKVYDSDLNSIYQRKTISKLIKRKMTACV